MGMIYKLKLLNFYCYLPDEARGDEIYILLNGERIWPINEKYRTVTEQVTKLDLPFEINKGDILDIELWDYDAVSRNDLLGKITLEASAHGKYKNDFTKTGSDPSKYALEYELG